MTWATTSCTRHCGHSVGACHCPGGSVARNAAKSARSSRARRRTPTRALAGNRVPAEVASAYLTAFYRANFAAAGRLLAGDFAFHGPFVQVRGRAEFLASTAGLGPIVRGHRLLQQWADGDQVCSWYDVGLQTAVKSGSVTMSEWHTIRDGKLTTGPRGIRRRRVPRLPAAAVTRQASPAGGQETPPAGWVFTAWRLGRPTRGWRWRRMRARTPRLITRTPRSPAAGTAGRARPAAGWRAPARTTRRPLPHTATCSPGPRSRHRCRDPR